MKRKIIALCVVTAMLAVAIVGSTMAYFTDTDQAVNVMTIGNVDILLHEQKRDGNGGYEDFVNAPELLPVPYAVNAYVDAAGAEIDGANGNLNAYKFLAYRNDSTRSAAASMPNVIDKIITVENTGRSSAYVRIIFAFEVTESISEIRGSDAIIGFMRNDIDSRSGDTGDGNTDWRWEWIEDKTVEIEGQKYVIAIATHEAVLASGETTIPALLQVYLKKDATQEQVNGYGNTYDIRILAQGIQSAGFEPDGSALYSASPASYAMRALNEGFGEITPDTAVAILAEGGMTVPKVIASYADINAYKGTDGNYILAKSFTADNIIHFGPGTNVTVDLNSQTITARNEGQFVIGAQQGAVLHLTGDGTVDAGKGFMTNKGGAEIIIDGGTYNTSVTTTLNKMKFTSLAQNNSKIVINGGTFTTDVDNAALFFATSNAVIEVNGGFFENTADSTPDLFSMGTNKGNTNRIVFKGGTFVNWNPLEDRMCYTGQWPGSYDAFQGPWMLVWDGYKVVSETQTSGDVWYSVLPE